MNTEIDKIHPHFISLPLELYQRTSDFTIRTEALQQKRTFHESL